MQRGQFHARRGGERGRKKLKICKEKNVSNEIKKSHKLHLSIVKGLDDENGYRSAEIRGDLSPCRETLGLSMAAKI